MQFLYFIPGRKRLKASDLNSFDLHHSIRKPLVRECFSALGGKNGIVFQDDQPGAGIPAYVPEEQEWIHNPDGVSVGWWRSQKPSVEQLARESQLKGKSLTLADGNSWLVPQLREWRPGDPQGPPVVYAVKVPQILEWQKQEWVERDVVPQYREIWDKSARAVALWLGRDDGKGTMDDGDLISFAADLLAVNYRVGPLEVSALGLLTIPLAVQIVRIGVDAAGLEDSLKNQLSRSMSEGQNSPSGVERQATETPASIDQHAVN